MKFLKLLFALFILICTTNFDLTSQKSLSQDEVFKDIINYRFIGPYRGGRATTAIGIPHKPYVFFMGTTGGGVWKSDDAGTTWNNISDGQIECGSIGAIAAHPKYSDIMYVGTGSDSPRGNISAGIGIYKSIDGGKTWTHKGLDKCGQIGDIIFHPDNPELAYVASLGNIFGPNKERGIFKTEDGGETWTHCFFLSDTTGAIDLAIHPDNPNILYAGMWRAERKPWTLIDGGYEGGLYKTINAGKTWNKVNNGLPEGLVGKIGVDISPSNPDIIYVIQQTAIEKDGGIYKSIDGGTNFIRITGDHKLRQRGWYYSRIIADPVDENTVYVTNTGLYRSIDGGKLFEQRLRVPHGDCHSVWINPSNPDIIINTNDGGATVTLNGGKTWSGQKNQPTSELYRISTDNQFPMRVYAGQQDNSTISVPIKSQGGLDPKQQWLEVGGGESGDVAISTKNPNIVYATTYSGIITRVDLSSGERRFVGAYPHYTEGTEQRNLKYRWQWNFPIRISQHDDNVIYHTSNYVHRSDNEGNSWEMISPDLTRNITDYQDIPGGPIQHDATGVEVYSTIFSFAESPTDKNVLWTGSDDGMVHVSRDCGISWQDVTPPALQKEATINHIELSDHNENTVFIVAYNYRYADFKPYIFKSENGGNTWTSIVEGINDGHFVRSFAQDKTDPNLLFAGTEYGMYLSRDGGKMWKKFQLNLPHTPITDMEIRGDVLVLSTQGRGFWIIDDLNLLRSWDNKTAQEDFKFFPISNTFRSNLGRASGPFGPEGAPYMVDMYMWSFDSTYKDNIYIIDNTQDTLFTIKDHEFDEGLNKISWNMRIKPPMMVKDLVMMDMSHPGQGPVIPPGTYMASIKKDENIYSQPFTINLDPRWKTPKTDFDQQYQIAKEVLELIEESQKRLMHLREVEKTIDNLKKRKQLLGIEVKLDSISTESKRIQDIIYQRKIITSQDEINFERKFTNHIIRLYRVILGQHGKPTDGEKERWEDLKSDYIVFDEAYTKFIFEMLSPVNAELKSLDIPFIPEEYGK